MKATGAQSGGPEVIPNPFSRRTTIHYTVVATARVDVRVYDAAGREVATLANEVAQPGGYTRAFDGSHLPAGVYLWRAVIGEDVTTGRVSLVR